MRGLLQTLQSLRQEAPFSTLRPQLLSRMLQKDVQALVTLMSLRQDQSPSHCRKSASKLPSFDWTATIGATSIKCSCHQQHKSSSRVHNYILHDPSKQKDQILLQK